MEFSHLTSMGTFSYPLQLTCTISVFLNCLDLPFVKYKNSQVIEMPL